MAASAPRWRSGRRRIGVRRRRLPPPHVPAAPRLSPAVSVGPTIPDSAGADTLLPALAGGVPGGDVIYRRHGVYGRRPAGGDGHRSVCYCRAWS